MQPVGLNNLSPDYYLIKSLEFKHVSYPSAYSHLFESSDSIALIYAVRPGGDDPLPFGKFSTLKLFQTSDVHSSIIIRNFCNDTLGRLACISVIQRPMTNFQVRDGKQQTGISEELLESFVTRQNDMAIIQRLHTLAVTASRPRNHRNMSVNNSLLYRQVEQHERAQ